MRILRAFTILMLFTCYNFAQDTLQVSWTFDGIHPAINNLFEVIKADTNRPVDRIYKLHRGGHYLLDSAITFDFPLKLVGEQAGETLESAPAIIQLTNDSLGNTQNKMLTGNGSLTLKNLWLTGSDTTGDQTNYQPIELNGENKKYLIENCVFTQSNFALIAFTNVGNSIHFKDNVFRNLIGKPNTQMWEGRGISIWADQDSVVIENNTFFNVGMTAFQFEGGASKFLLFVHNTIVNAGWSVVQGWWWREAFFVNNLIVNGFWYGITPTMRNDISFEEGKYGFFNIGNLPPAYGPEQGRRIKISNNVAWNDNAFDSYYTDSIFNAPFLGSAVNRDFIDEYYSIVAYDTIWADPGLNTPFSEDHYNNMIQNIVFLRQDNTPAPDYFWMLPEKEDGSICYTCINWPLPEDFSYTNDALQSASSAGAPLGDLNWFPEDKKFWEGNRDYFIYEITTIFPVPKLVWPFEAEDGIFSGNTVIDTASGTLSILLNAGYIKWDFELEQAGKYDLNVHLNLNGRQYNGVNFYVNDYEIHDSRAWGQYVFGNDEDSIYPEFPLTGFDWWLISESGLKEEEIADAPLDLQAGANSIEIKASWCDNFFGEIQVLEAGTQNVEKTLNPVDATYEHATPYVDDDTIPSNFRTVLINENGGSVSWKANFPIFIDPFPPYQHYALPGYYSLHVFCKALEGQQEAIIRVNDVPVINDFIISENSNLHTEISKPFLISSRDDTITLQSQNIEIDYIHFNFLYPATNIEQQRNPQKYQLNQNYPNPFNPETVISYQLSMNSDVVLRIFDVMGREIQTLVNKKQSAGQYSVIFNAQHLASGIYFYRIETGNFIQQKKMFLIK